MNRLGLLKKLIPIVAILLLTTDTAFAAAQAQNFGQIATSISKTLSGFGQLIINGCYVAGLALTGAAILKFKAHKDNPTQVPLGTPISLLFIGAALLWMPSIIQSTGATAGFTQQASLGAPGSIASF